MLLCAITDRQRLPWAGSTAAEAEAARRRQLHTLLRDWVEGGVDFVQLREKDLSSEALLVLAGELLAGPARRQAKILINLPASSLAAAEDGLVGLIQLCDGIHLPGKPVEEDAQLVRQAFRRHGRECLVSMSCHSVEEVRVACRARVEMVFYAPVFGKEYAPGGEKKYAPEGEKKYALGGDAVSPDGPSRSMGQNRAQGLAALRLACEAAEGMPVFALGGVTVSNAPDCLGAGAAGVAGIRLFQEGDWRGLRPAPAGGNHI